jgi:hypothetical protein
MDTGTADASCQQNCIDSNPTGVQKLTNYELQSCGCQGSAPCAGQCTAECANPSSYMPGSPCDTCIGNQAGMGTGSACNTSAITQCAADSTCATLITCIQKCP